jgi:hypothetical protein
MEELILTYITHISKKSGGHCGTSVPMIASHLEVSTEEVMDVVAILLAEGKIEERKSLNHLIYFPNGINRTRRKRI